MNKNVRKPAGQKVNWSAEVADSGRLAGRVIGRIISYILNALLTVMLICLITGICDLPIPQQCTKNSSSDKSNPTDDITVIRNEKKSIANVIIKAALINHSFHIISYSATFIQNV